MKDTEMKTRTLFLLSVAAVFTVFTSCEKKDPLVTLNTSNVLIYPPRVDTSDASPVAEPVNNLPFGPTAVLWANCTGAIVGFNVPDAGIQSTDKGVCVNTLPNPTTSYIVGYTENSPGFYKDNMWYNSWSCIDGLQPETQYYARSWYTVSDSTFYSEQISFYTSPRPVIKTGEASLITASTVMIGGNITSTGGSFVVEKGVCCSLSPFPEPYGHDPYIELEVQSGEATGEFTAQLMGLIPGKLYYARAFVGVVTGIEYGDQLFAYGDVITFVTK